MMLPDHVTAAITEEAARLRAEASRFAFALPGDNADTRLPAQCGLTKREYFAALALQGVIASCDAISFSAAAKCAVKHADALIDKLNSP